MPSLRSIRGFAIGGENTARTELEAGSGERGRTGPQRPRTAQRAAQKGSGIVPPMLATGCNRAKAIVLIVDDSPEMLRYLRALLELDSYQVETASNGSEALQRVRDGCAPAIVLLDLQMPGMDGLKTLRGLRKLQPDLKVIMCSGVDDPGQIRRAVSLGAQAYLTKPVRHLYLSAALERCLNGAGMRETAVGANVVALPVAHGKEN